MSNAAIDASPSQAVPAEFEDYALIERLGEDTEGALYHAEQTSTGRLVTLKIWRTPTNFDAPDLAKLDHPRLLPWLATGTIEGRPYAVMEFHESLDLNEVLHRLGRLSTADAAAIVQQTAEGIQHLLQQGRAIDPIPLSGILLQPDGQVKLTVTGSPSQRAVRRSTQALADLWRTLLVDQPLPANVTTPADVIAALPPLAAPGALSHLFEQASTTPPTVKPAPVTAEPPLPITRPFHWNWMVGVVAFLLLLPSLLWLRPPAATVVPPTPTQATVVMPDWWIVDHGDPGYAETARPGSRGWRTGTDSKQATATHQSSYRYADDGAMTASWTFTDLPPGTYDVLASWSTGPHRARRVEYVLTTEAMPPLTAVVNQREKPAEVRLADHHWRQLAVVELLRGPLVITLDVTAADGMITADAILVRPTPGGSLHAK